MWKILRVVTCLAIITLAQCRSINDPADEDIVIIGRVECNGVPVKRSSVTMSDQEKLSSNSPPLSWVATNEVGRFTVKLKPEFIADETDLVVVVYHACDRTCATKSQLIIPYELMQRKTISLKTLELSKTTNFNKETENCDESSNTLYEIPGQQVKKNSRKNKKSEKSTHN